MMRIGKAALLAAVLAAPAFSPGVAVAQSLLGNAQPDQGSADQSNPVVIPPAPPIVASPPTRLPTVVPEAQPPGLVETPVPPANADPGQADNGATQPAGTAGAPPVGAPQAGMPQAGAPQAGAQPAPAAGQPAASAPDTASSTPPPVPNNWVPEHTAELGILDKVDGGTNTVTIPVGGQATAGDLQISVLACDARPPDEVPDDAVFVAIQPMNATPPAAAPQSAQPAGGSDGSGAALFRGWMVRSIPGATVVGDASETLRVVSCS
jgi:hypothetical protein